MNPSEERRQRLQQVREGDRAARQLNQGVTFSDADWLKGAIPSLSPSSESCSAR